mmetsp:Transcript_19982/g.58012  ORF Transcript_19982/g.58012 Transcript_19982/m.58012 type:complete len:114 (+) Transcript_19982:3-344(+)
MNREARKAGIDMVPHYRFYTPAGLHSVVDFYNEWHFLDALYKSFPQQESWSNWERAGEMARAVVDSLNSWNDLRRAQRRGQDVATEELQRAQDGAEGHKAAYRRAFLPEPATA